MLPPMLIAPCRRCFVIAAAMMSRFLPCDTRLMLFFRVYAAMPCRHDILILRLCHAYSAFFAFSSLLHMTAMPPLLYATMMIIDIHCCLCRLPLLLRRCLLLRPCRAARWHLHSESLRFAYSHTFSRLTLRASCWLSAIAYAASCLIRHYVYGAARYCAFSILRRRHAALFLRLFHDAAMPRHSALPAKSVDSACCASAPIRAI